MSIGIPLFQATITFTSAAGVSAPFPAYWSGKGSIIPQFSAEEFSVLESNDEDGGSFTVSIVLDEDTSVCADISWDEKQGFVPVGDALSLWIRKTYPDDCAYLDEVEYPATLYWVKPDKSVVRMGAKWLNTGEVRPRPPANLLHELMDLRWSLGPGAHIGHIVLRADSTIVAAVQLNENNEITAPCFAFEEWRAAQAPAQ